MHPLHPWMARLIVCAIMLVLSFVGLVFTNVKASGAWNFWCWTAPVYALSAIWLSWYLRRRTESRSLLTVWYELLHWVGYITFLFLTSLFVKQGLVGRFEAALFALTLTSFSTFLAGVYIETTFLFIGILLGGFAALVAFVEEYFYAFALMLLLSAGLVFTAWIWWKKRQKKEPPPESKPL